VIPTFAGLIWALPALGVVRMMRQQPHVRDAKPVDDIPLSIIIPARNEAETLPILLDSLSKSTYGQLEIIVVDDRSTDGTREVAAGFAERFPQIRVIDGEPLPHGWFGKPWACHQGSAAATGRLLLFTDADTCHWPELHRQAVGTLIEQRADLLTLTSTQLCETFWERVLMPQIWYLLGTRYAPAAVNRARYPWQMVANGQFIMVKAETYRAAGGHEAVRGEVAEDLAIAQHWFRSSLTCRMNWGDGMLSTRMYRSLAEMVEGWSKNLYLGGRLSMPDSAILRAMAAPAVALSFVFWLVPPVAWLIGYHEPAVLLALGLCLLNWLAVMVAMKIPPLYALAWPLGAATALVVLIRSWWRGERRVAWRGRTYDVTQ
jgi:chlorobactene glucosyltransferase